MFLLPTLTVYRVIRRWTPFEKDGRCVQQGRLNLLWGGTGHCEEQNKCEVVNNKIHKKWMDLIAIKTRGSHLNSICDGNVGDGMFL